MIAKLFSLSIAIHHECPCRIEISHPRGQNFNQGQGLPCPSLNSNPEGEIFLSNMERLMMDCFSPTFPRLFLSEHKKSKQHEKNEPFTRWIYIISELTSVFIGY